MVIFNSYVKLPEGNLLTIPNIKFLHLKMNRLDKSRNQYGATQLAAPKKATKEVVRTCITRHRPRSMGAQHHQIESHTALSIIFKE